MGKVKISAPSNLNEITLRQYPEYQEVENPTERDLLRIFLSLSDSVIDKITLAEVTRVAGIVANLLKQEAKFQNIFTLNGVKYGFVPSLDQISYGEHDDATEFLTAVKYIEDGEERVPIPDMKNLHKGLAVLYRKVTTQTFGKYDIEEYTVPIAHEEEFRDMPFGVALGALVFFLRFNQRFAKSYPELFSSGGGEGEDNTFLTKWGRYNRLHALTGGDLLKVDAIAKRSAHECYTFLAYKQDEARYQKSQLKT